jgi:hypothetical protein
MALCLVRKEKRWQSAWENPLNLACFIKVVFNCQIYCLPDVTNYNNLFNPLNAELNPVCHLLALLGAHSMLQVSRIRVNKSL